MVTDEQLAEMRQRAAEARARADAASSADDLLGPPKSLDQIEKDMAFWIGACTDVPTLAADVDTLAAEVERLRAERAQLARFIAAGYESRDADAAWTKACEEDANGSVSEERYIARRKWSDEATKELHRAARALPDGPCQSKPTHYAPAPTTEDDLDARFDGALIPVSDIAGSYNVPGWRCRACGWTVGIVDYPPSHTCGPAGDGAGEPLS